MNINSMAVAPVSRLHSGGEGEVIGGGMEKEPGGRSSEALMILGVDREVGEEVVEALLRKEGILDVSVVGL